MIDAIQDVELRDKLRTVCLTDDRCYMTFANAECLERALHTAFGVRDVPVLLMDTGAGAVILSLTGVPDTVTDKDVLKCLKKYGTIIGKENQRIITIIIYKSHDVIFYERMCDVLSAEIDLLLR